MSHPQEPPPHPREPPPYRYGPEQPSGSQPPAQAYPPSGPGSPGSDAGSHTSGPHPTDATEAYQPGAPQPGAQQASGQPAYGYPPGQPGGHPYGGPKGPTNQLAVASLVLGILTPLACIPGILSIIFGIIALVQIQERWEKGRGLAIGGMAATGAWVVVALVATVVVTVLDYESGGAEPRNDRDRTAVDRLEEDPRTAVDQPEEGRRTPVYRLEVGQCVESLPPWEEEWNDFLTVECDLPHEAEVYATFDLSYDDYPGDDAVIKEGDDGCLERLRQDLPHAYADPDVDVGFLYPDSESWAFGDREVICIATFLDGTRSRSLFDVDESLADIDDPTGIDRIPYYELQAGQCVESLRVDEEDAPGTFLIVDCDLPHEAEVYATFDLSYDDWPGDDLAYEEADDGCFGRLRRDHPDAWDDPDVEVYYVYPSEEVWDLGDHGVICIATYLDGTRTGSLFD